MNVIPSASPLAVPSIRIHTADDASALFEDEMLATDPFTLCGLENGLYSCSPGLQSEYIPFPHPSPELEDIPELSHLSSTNHLFLTGHSGYALPYPAILQEHGASVSADRGLSPSALGSPIHSPTSSLCSSLSPSSLHDSLMLSENESPHSPSPTTPDHLFWPTSGLNRQNSDPLLSYPYAGSTFSNDPIPPSSLGPQAGPQRCNMRSSSASRAGPVASKAMLEANGRRRRHPAQHECPDCGQTFTALFSLKRHAQSHTGERPFVCGIPGCTQRFFNSSDCKRHEKSKKRHKELSML